MSRGVVLDNSETWQPLCDIGHVTLPLWASAASSIKQKHGLTIRDSLTLVCDVFTDFQKRQCKEFFYKAKFIWILCPSCFFFKQGG